MIIGITGKSGSGKTTLSKKFEEKGFVIINIDELAHKVLDEDDVKEEVEKMFSISYTSINRIELGDLVFNNRDCMHKLADIIGVRISNEIDKIVNENPNVVIEWILLPKLSVFNKCDIKILLQAVDTERKERVINRDQITNEYYDAREKNSITYDEIAFDYIMHNDYVDEINIRGIISPQYKRGYNTYKIIKKGGFIL